MKAELKEGCSEKEEQRLERIRQLEDEIERDRTKLLDTVDALVAAKTKKDFDAIY